MATMCRTRRPRSQRSLDTPLSRCGAPPWHAAPQERSSMLTDSSPITSRRRASRRAVVSEH
eukprot:52334-Eustigmatos_ZCMA.PRE.1